MRRERLSDLEVFLTVAEERSFTRAASKLGTSQSAVSQIVRRLEASMGLQLLTRNTRSVTPTEAGDKLVQTLRPAFDEIDGQIASLSELRAKPSGSLRITTSRHAAETVLWPTLGPFLESYPDVTVELSIDAALTDIVADRFDAGVRLGEQLARDMIAIPIGPDLRLAVVGSPEYFARNPVPREPHDLTSHRCINIRMSTRGGNYIWEFEKEGRAINVRVDGPLVLNDSILVLRAAADGTGLACVMEDLVLPLIAEGRLVRVLEDWTPPFSGYHLYYPDRRQVSPAMRRLVDAFKHGPAHA